MDTPSTQIGRSNNPLKGTVSMKRLRVFLGLERARRTSIHAPNLTALQEVLIGASAAGDRATIEALLDEGIDPNGITSEGKTALDVAATDPIRNLLLRRGGERGELRPESSIRRRWPDPRN